MRDFLLDLNIGMRGLIRRPGFVAVAIVTLGLGIGASTSMFSIVYGVVLQPLPFDSPDRIVQLVPTDDGGDSAWSGANYIDFAAQNTSFESIAGYRAFSFSLTDGEFPSSQRGACVTAGFFDVLGVAPAMGRTLAPSIDVPGGEKTVVLSQALWQSAYGADPGIIGRSIDLNGVSYAVVGIMPAGFAYPERMSLWYISELRVPDPPFAFPASPEEIRGANYFSAIARLKQGVGIAQGQEEASAIAARLRADFPDEVPQLGFRVRSLAETIVGEVKPALMALFGAVGFVLLIACANVANLLLVRAAGRRREVAIRRALGAGGLKLVRQMLVESLVLGLAGGVVGLALSFWGTDALVALASSQLPRTSEVGISYAVLVFTVSLSVVCGLLFGLVPVRQAWREEPASVLRGEEGRLSGGPTKSVLRRVLIIGEIAISVVLLVGACLMIRTLASVGSADPGFTERDALTARLYIPSTKYSDDEQVRTFYRDALDRIRALPGVTSATGTLSLPVSPGINGELTFIIEGRPEEPGNDLVAGYQSATDGYFESIGLPLIEGRTFNSEDRDGAPLVAVMSQAAAEEFFPGESAIGKRMSWNGDTEDPEFEWVTIVGVVGNTLHQGLDAVPRMEIYQPFEQAPIPFMTLIVKTTGPAEAQVNTLRRAVMQVDPDQPLTQVRTLHEVLHESLAQRRFNMVVMAVFAGLALLMAGVGLYGVLSYAVAQRGREIGIRMALGAGRQRILGQVLGEGGKTVAVGLGIGILGALAFSRLISGLIHGIPTLDPVAFAAGSAALCAIAMIASVVPAFRATRVDPMVSLRRE